jgi:endonuclease YncB( thermonuclease family)
MLWLVSLLVGIILTFASQAIAEQFTGKVVGVTDGDTIKVMRSGKAEKIRLAGIDCPERKQAYGTRAKQFTSDMAFGKVVTVKVETVDQYGRTVGEVILPDGRSLNHELVKAGFAWWYRQYSRDISLGQLEEEARIAKRGLWADPNAIPPWEYRKLRKALK